MKLTQLQYFCEVYRQRNVSRAAEKLNISQPSISAAIKELEGEFGIAAVFREGRRHPFHAGGRHFYEHAQSLLTHADSFRMKMLDLSRREELRFGVPPMIARWCAGTVWKVSGGAVQLPAAHCRRRPGNTDGGAEEPPDRYGPAAPRHAFPQFETKRVGTMETMCCVSRGHPAARQSERFHL